MILHISEMSQTPLERQSQCPLWQILVSATPWLDRTQIWWGSFCCSNLSILWASYCVLNIYENIYSNHWRPSKPLHTKHESDFYRQTTNVKNVVTEKLEKNCFHCLIFWHNFCRCCKIWHESYFFCITLRVIADDNSRHIRLCIRLDVQKCVISAQTGTI